MIERPRAFVDTNVLIYAHTDDDLSKRGQAEAFFRENAGRSMIISAQTMGELYRALTAKHRVPADAAGRILDAYMSHLPVCAITRKIVREAVNIQRRYGYQYWDCQILASALLADCEIIFSEDMQDKQIVFGRLQIINPFRATNH